MHILHSKLFECTFYTLNYDSYYTLHPAVKFTINLYENSNFRLQSVIKSIVYGDKV